MNTTNSPSYGELLIQYHYAIMADDTRKIQEIKNRILDMLEANNGPITREEIERRGFDMSDSRLIETVGKAIKGEEFFYFDGINIEDIWKSDLGEAVYDYLYESEQDEIEEEGNYKLIILDGIETYWALKTPLKYYARVKLCRGGKTDVCSAYSKEALLDTIHRGIKADNVLPYDGYEEGNT